MDCSNLQRNDILQQTIIPGDTQNLKLSGNNLQSISDLKDILISLTSVHEIQLHDNNIKELGEGLFSQNCNLKVLSLGHGNEEVKMDPNLFIGSDKIEILDLGAAKADINNELFIPLPNLQYLFLQLNNIPKITSRHRGFNLFEQIL